MSAFLQRKQRGAALLTAMIIVTLVAALAAAMVWHQQRALQVEASERSRSQADWMLLGALDWARLILREDAVSNQNRKNWDHLGEPWAVPLAEARLSTFLGGDDKGTPADDGPAAFLSGRIDDAQARYNLRNLLVSDPARLLIEQRTLAKLCELAGASPGTASLIDKQLHAAFASEPAADAPLQIDRARDLIWLGLPQDVVARLAPFLTLLPQSTPVNLNTAPREVIAALVEGLDLASAERLVQARQNAPLASTADAGPYLPSSVVLPADRASVVSSYFYVTGRLRLDEHVLVQRALVRRVGVSVSVLERETASEVSSDTPNPSGPQGLPP
ncbi:type II secretion system minor pseudopilin GspK [Burkholderiaceae bacterium UC74_6]